MLDIKLMTTVTQDNDAHDDSENGRAAAAPRSAHLLTKSLVHKQLGCTRQGEGGELKTREREEKIGTQTTPRLEPTAQRPQATTRLFRTEEIERERAILNMKYDPD